MALFDAGNSLVCMGIDPQLLKLSLRRARSLNAADEFKLTVLGSNAHAVQSTLFPNAPQNEESLSKKLHVDGRSAHILMSAAPLPKAGSEGLLHQMARDADGIVFVYDAASRASFNEVKAACNALLRGQQTTSPIMILSSRSDQSQRDVSTEEGTTLAASFSLPFFEISAARRPQVELAVSQLVRDIREDRAQASLADAADSARVSLMGKKGPKDSSCVIC